MEENFLKLTNAVYKVLEFFPESDPLKNRAKDKALAIMDNLVLLNETNSLPAIRQGWATLGEIFSEEKIKANLLEDIDMLLGYLFIAKSQGWLNSVNYLIIANQYEKIRNIATPTIELTQKLPGILDKRLAVAGQFDEPVTIPRQKLKHYDGDLVGEVLPVAKKSPPSDKLTARQREIIEFLNKNEKAQVMDLQTVLPDVTKRTIRRDLDELLNTGKIVRHGDFNQVFYKINKTQVLTS